MGDPNSHEFISRKASQSLEPLQHSSVVTTADHGNNSLHLLVFITPHDNRNKHDGILASVL